MRLATEGMGPAEGGYPRAWTDFFVSTGSVWMIAPSFSGTASTSALSGLVREMRLSWGGTSFFQRACTPVGSMSASLNLPDARNYSLEGVSAAGGATKIDFGVDSTRPTYSVTGSVAGSKIIADDATSGIKHIVVCYTDPDGSCRETVTYPGDCQSHLEVTLTASGRTTNGGVRDCADRVGDDIAVSTPVNRALIPEHDKIAIDIGGTQLVLPKNAPIWGASVVCSVKQQDAPPGYQILYPGSAVDVASDIVIEGTMSIVVPYDPAALGLDEEQQTHLKLFAFPEGVEYQDITLHVDTAAHTVTAEVEHLHPYALVIATEHLHIPPPFDSMPPRTSIAFDGLQHLHEYGLVHISSYTSISLVPVDTAAANAPLAGPATTYYIVDWNSGLCPFDWLSPTVSNPEAPAGTCANPLYHGSFQLPGGRHRIFSASVDKAGNLESARAEYVNVDGLPPEIESFEFQGPVLLAENNAIIISSRTKLAPVADDPPEQGIYSGVATTYFLVDGDFSNCDFDPLNSTFDESRSSGTCANPVLRDFFMLEPGSHDLSYFAVDWVRHVGPIGSTHVVVDASAPVTRPLVMGSNGYDDEGRLFVPGTLPDIVLSPEDKSAGDLSAGVATTYFLKDVAPAECGVTNFRDFAVTSSSEPEGTCSNPKFNTPLHFVEGLHHLTFASDDRLGNAEDLRTLEVAVDTVPPITSLSVAGPSSAVPAGLLFISGVSSIVLTGIDQAVNYGVLPEERYLRSGSATTYLLVDKNPHDCGYDQGPPVFDPDAPVGSCLNPFYKGPMPIEGGLHVLGFFSSDKVGNQEVLRIAPILVDTTPPVATIFSANGSTFTIGQPGFTIAASVSDDYDPAPLMSLVLVQTLNKGPAGVTSLPVSTGQIIDPRDLDDGMWRLMASATDFVMNSTTAFGGEFEVIHDTLPPRTALLPATVVSGQVFASRSSPIVLISTDDLLSVGDGIGLGVAYQELWEGGTLIARNPDPLPGSVFSSTFSLASLADGLHTLSYFGEDILNHKEEVRSSVVAVDGSSPTVSFQILGGTRTDLLGRTILSTSTLVVLSGSDPIVGGVASGVKSLRLTLDSIQEVIPGTYTVRVLAEGLHSLSVLSEDYAGNLSPIFSTNVIVDVSPPQIWDAKARPAGSGDYQPTSQAISNMTVDARVKVRDLYSGLNISGAPLIALTTDAYTVGLWHLNELPGSTTAYDSSVRHNDARVSTSVLFVPGLFGNAVNTNQPPFVPQTLDVCQRPVMAPRIIAPTSNFPTGSSPVSMEGWVRTTFTGLHTAFGYGNQASNQLRAVDIWTENNQSQVLVRLGYYGNDCNVVSNVNVQDGQWHHLAATYDGSTTRIYVDGSIKGSCYNGAVNTPSGSTFVIGNRPYTGPSCYMPFNGDIDEVRVQSTVLGAAQIALDAKPPVKPFMARLSTDGGASFQPAGAVLLAPDATTLEHTMTASGLNLKHSIGPSDQTNQVEFTVADLAGYSAMARYTLLVNLNPVTPPLPASPGDGIALRASTVTISWALDPTIPSQAIANYTLQLARDPGFSTGLVEFTSTASAITTQALADGEYYWRVAANDNFGTSSPYSQVRRFSIDASPPAFSEPQAARAGSPDFMPAASWINATLVDARAQVQDLSAGLDISSYALVSLQPDQHTVGLWHLNELPGSTTAYDSSVRHNDARVSTSVLFVPGLFGNAVNTNQPPMDPPTLEVCQRPIMAPRVIAPTSNFPTGSSPVSMEGWVRTTFKGYQTAFGYGYQASNQLRAVDIWTENNQSQVLVRLGYYGNDCNVVSNVNVQDGQWHHLAATYDGSITRIYVDGAMQGSCYNGAVNTPSGSTFVIGNRPYTGPSCYMPFSGDIDEVRVQSIVLSADQIALDARKPIEASWVRVSTDGGKTYALVPGADQSLTGEPGTRLPQTMTARNLSLVESMSSTQPLNFVEMTAKDLLGNATSFTFAIRVDTTPPVVAISTPVAGAVFLAGLDRIPVAFSLADRLDPSPAVTAVLVRTSDTGKADGWLYSLDVSTLGSVDAMLLDDGIWELQVSATDFAGNWSSATSGSFEIKHDTLPPRTTLALGEPKHEAGLVYVSSSTELTLAAEDDLIEIFDKNGFGVASTGYRLDDGSLSPYEGSIRLVQDGPHAFEYFSTDKAGNVEPVRSLDVAVDTVAPVSRLTVQGGSRTLDGTLYARADIAVLSQDPAPNGSASGVKDTLVSADAGEFSPVLPVLADGAHVLRFYGVDNVGNTEAVREKSVVLDRVSPAAVNLSVVEPSTDALTLVWTTPGDNGGSGPIADGELRIWRSSSSSSPELLQAQVVETLLDQVAGLPKTKRVSGLAPGSTYHFALWTMDTAGNWSEPALASAATLALAGSTDSVVSVLSAEAQLLVTPIAPVDAPGAYKAASDQGLLLLTTYYYDLGTEAGEVGFSTPAVLRFVIDPFGGDPEDVSIYRYSGVEWSSAPILNLARSYEPPRLELTGELLHTSLYAAFMRVDILPPVTTLSIGEPKYASDPVYVSSATLFVLSAQDNESVPVIGFSLDSDAFTLYTGPITLGSMQVADGAHTFKYFSTDASGNKEQVHSAAITLDAAAPETALSLSTPSVGDFITSATVITLIPSDAGSGLEWTRYRVDSGGIMSEPLSLSLTGADGSHLLEYWSRDRLGNLESPRTRQLAVDNTAPTIALGADQPLVSAPGGYSIPSATATITLTLADQGSGLGLGQYVLDGATVAFAFSPGDASAQSSKLLASGAHSLTVRGTDRLGNPQEQTWSIAVGGDTQAPQVAMLSPCPSAAGACKAVEGVITVRGTVSDENLASWSLARGTTLIISGTSSGEVTGAWDTTGLHGYQTLTLTAVDAVGNTASASVQVFVGEPSRTLILGSRKSLHHPHGVASLAGKIYVADTNADKLLIFDAQGLPVAAYGNAKQVEPYFDKPKAVDVDSSGNIFVADTRHHRVVKLSPAGQLILQLGKLLRPGKGNGQFRQPSGVAVGQDGRIYVSDTGNRRIQVFGPDGSFRLAFDLPDTDRELDPDDEDSDEAAPFGIDVDAAGNIYVADAKGRRVLVFDPSGTLASKLDRAKLFRRPEGIAVSQDGSCIFVSDRGLDRILRFDSKGEAALDFGKHGEIKDDKPSPSETAFNKPIGLALDQAGRLLVADRNNERIQGFGLPPETLLIASGETSSRRYGTASVEAVSEAGTQDLFARVTVEKDKGGKLQRVDRVAVAIPAGALADDIELSIAQPQDDPKRRRPHLTPASQAVEFGPDGTRFDAPVTITLPYAADGDGLMVYYWNPVKEEWEPLDSSVDRDSRTVSAKTMHFSIYQVFGRGITAAAGADSSFVLREAYAFPNPAVGGAKPTIHVEVGVADQVAIRIYDVAGDKVHEAALHGAPNVINGEYAYEYTWDGRIASGVYFYTIDAQKGGQHIRRVGKLAVVR